MSPACLRPPLSLGTHWVEHCSIGMPSGACHMYGLQPRATAIRRERGEARRGAARPPGTHSIEVVACPLFVRQGSAIPTGGRQGAPAGHTATFHSADKKNEQASVFPLKAMPTRRGTYDIRPAGQPYACSCSSKQQRVWMSSKRRMHACMSHPQQHPAYAISKPNQPQAAIGPAMHAPGSLSLSLRGDGEGRRHSRSRSVSVRPYKCMSATPS